MAKAAVVEPDADDKGKGKFGKGKFPFVKAKGGKKSAKAEAKKK